MLARGAGGFIERIVYTSEKSPRAAFLYLMTTEEVRRTGREVGERSRTKRANEAKIDDKPAPVRGDFVRPRVRFVACCDFRGMECHQRFRPRDG